MFAALGRPAPRWEDVDQDADLADELAARDRDGAPAPVSVAGAVADTLPAGPGAAAWLSGHDPAGVSDHDAVAMAAAFRRVASWAQAGELAMVAQIAARSAARDPDCGLAADGRPAHVTRDAAAQVSLELVLSSAGAEAWTGLALALAWRLPGTAAALADGRIDLVRARILAEAVAPLSDEAAAAVEALVLPRAGDQTYAQLHAAVRRAVIAADPDGAEQRRQAAERRAKVALYPDQDCTATLTGTRLPAAHAAAAMARLSALARAMKAAGAGGGIDLLRAHAYLGLLLGTLPLIPPPADGPPDADPPGGDDDDGIPPPDQDDDPPDRDQDDGTQPPRRHDEPPGTDCGSPGADYSGPPPSSDAGCPGTDDGRPPGGDTGFTGTGQGGDWPPGGEGGCPGTDQGDGPAGEHGGGTSGRDHPGRPPAPGGEGPAHAGQHDQPPGSGGGSPGADQDRRPTGERSGAAGGDRGEPPRDRHGTGAPRRGHRVQPPGSGRDRAAAADGHDPPPASPGDHRLQPSTSESRPPSSESRLPGSDSRLPGSDLPSAGPWTDAPPLTDTDLRPDADNGWHGTPPPLPPGYADWDPDRGDPLDHDHYADPGIIPPWPPAPTAIPVTWDLSPAAAGATRPDPTSPDPTSPDPANPGRAGPMPADPGRASPDPASLERAGPMPADSGRASHERAGDQLARPGPADGRPPPGGLLDLTLPWVTLAGTADAPGTLGRVGPITAAQARQLARLGTRNHATQWRVILTSPDGTAIAVARIPRTRLSPRAAPAGPLPSTAGLRPGRTAQAGTVPAEPAPTLGRVTVIMPAADLDSAPNGPELTSPGLTSRQLTSRQLTSLELTGFRVRIIAAARRARDAARRRADADGNAPGGCAHGTASPAYRPPTRIREYVVARDQTCRNPRCRQPAWRADLDHTRPYHLGGLTCGCNLGGACRSDHQLKQLPGWGLTQPEPGVFQWTTPAGRIYATRPDPHYTG